MTPPTQAEIEAACIAIQATWTDAERRSRKVARPPLTYVDRDARRKAQLAIDATLAERRERSSSRAGA